VAFPSDPQDIARRFPWTIPPTQSLFGLGNPNLKPKTADNIDVLFEHYLNPFGVITAGYFYKNLTGPIVTHTFDNVNHGNIWFCRHAARPHGGRPAESLSRSMLAVLGSTVFEVAYLQHLTFLPVRLLVWHLANYGYTASRTSFGPISAARTILGSCANAPTPGMLARPMIAAGFFARWTIL